MNKAKLRIIVAGQIPPPVGGQNLMIEQILRELQSFPNLTCEHLPFYFTPSFRESRRLKFYKILELFLVIHRLIMLRLQGNIDLILYPVGGSHLVPLLRDVFLLPWMLLLSRKMVLQFHAAGAAKMFQNHYRIFLPVIRFLYKKAAAAVVMTDYNKRDPEFFGIQPVFVLPHQLRDEYQPSYVSRRRETVNILSLGHICPDKGSDLLLEAFSNISPRYPNCRLILAGECLPPWNSELLRTKLSSLGITNKVTLAGLLRGEDKTRILGQTDLFIFPSRAPYESFGLVLVEALMWGLPIIASDWHGNRNVLGDHFDGSLFSIDNQAAHALGTAIEQWLSGRQSSNSGFSERNRQLYLEKYSHNQDSGYNDMFFNIANYKPTR